jgi:wyosine [tRNA(Phe)-imidazoG37] synthetase (radical SAM superfamily)
VENEQKIDNRLAAVQNHSRVFNEALYVYPVISRRSRGLSVGVNLNPDKVCNFNCVYCEVDRVTPPRIRHVDLNLLREELTSLVRFIKDGELARVPRFADAPELALNIRDFAFSGDGEPTMVMNFDACVQLVVDIKQAENLPQARIVLITDAAGLDKASVQRGLALMQAHQGEIWAKLDAGTEEYYRLVNRSHIQFSRILNNILITARTRPIVVQTLFLKIRDAMMPRAELDAYCGRLRGIVEQGGVIREVQAYTVARPTPEAFATKLELVELEEIARIVREQTGLTVLTYP